MIATRRRAPRRGGARAAAGLPPLGQSQALETRAGLRVWSWRAERAAAQPLPSDRAGPGPCRFHGACSRRLAPYPPATPPQRAPPALPHRACRAHHLRRRCSYRRRRCLCGRRIATGRPHCRRARQAGAEDPRVFAQRAAPPRARILRASRSRRVRCRSGGGGMRAQSAASRSPPTAATSSGASVLRRRTTRNRMDDFMAALAGPSSLGGGTPKVGRGRGIMALRRRRRFPGAPARQRALRRRPGVGEEPVDASSLAAGGGSPAGGGTRAVRAEAGAGRCRSRRPKRSEDATAEPTWTRRTPTSPRRAPPEAGGRRCGRTAVRLRHAWHGDRGLLLAGSPALRGERETSQPSTVSAVRAASVATTRHGGADRTAATLSLRAMTTSAASPRSNEECVSIMGCSALEPLAPERQRTKARGCARDARVAAHRPRCRAHARPPRGLEEATTALEARDASRPPRRRSPLPSNAPLSRRASPRLGNGVPRRPRGSKRQRARSAGVEQEGSQGG